MERHLRKAFPQIQQSELNLLNPTSATALSGQGWNGDSWTLATGFVAGIRNDFDVRVAVGPNFVAADMKVMDPAEALVFFLGGFSSNPKQPFTGDGRTFLTSGGQWNTILSVQNHCSNLKPIVLPYSSKHLNRPKVCQQ